MNIAITPQEMDEKKWRYYQKTGERGVEIVKDKPDESFHSVGMGYTVHFKRTNEIDEELIFIGRIEQVFKYGERNEQTANWMSNIIPERHLAQYNKNQVAAFVMGREGLGPGDTASFLVINYYLAYSIDENGVQTNFPLPVEPNDSFIGINI